MDYLDKIFASKKKAVEASKELTSIDDFLDKISQQEPRNKDFFNALSASDNQYQIIAETKKGSPSAGIIKNDYDPISIAQSYESAGYTNISVLTEESYFFGQKDDLSRIAKHTELSILRKDFIFDEWQLYETKSIGADCVLLIAEYLSEQELNKLINVAKCLQLDVLLEFHEEQELSKVLNQNLDYVGINNRNLKTLETNNMHALSIFHRYFKDLQRTNIIAESGFSKVETLDIYQKEGINKFLIGEGLLKGSL